MITAVNYARIVASIYLFLLGSFLALAGYWPLTPVFAPLFLAAGTAALLGSSLFILQTAFAYTYARLLRPALFSLWCVFTLKEILLSYYQHLEAEPWPDILLNFFVCLLLATILLPLLLVPTRREA